MNRIKTIDITNFRHLNNLNSIKIGDRITVIAGVNGTGKSTLLGLIGHIFTFRNNSKIVKSIDNKPFETIFSEVFRFSPDFDYEGKYTYSLTLEDNTKKEATSRYIAKNKRFRIDVGARQRSSGKVRLPVIYLGLKRLIPLAQESEKSIKIIRDNKLSTEEKRLFQEWHNRVLVINDDVVPQHTKSRNKEVYYPVCDKYDAYGNSAGQDNLAQIILALISFKHLKEQMGTDYPGGLLLIDEVDTTLYPAAQYQLMKLFLKTAAEYDLQIIFTTHSTDVITYMLGSNNRPFYHSSEIVFLHNPLGIIQVVQDKSQLNGMMASLRQISDTMPIKHKVNVYLEDEEARIFLKGIIPRLVLTNLEIIRKISFGADFYKTLLEKKFPEFKRSLIILDGDKANDSKLKRNKNVLFLPGQTRPENVLLDYLIELPIDHNFWESRLGGYNKQVFLNNKPVDPNNREIMKAWFNSEKQHWGRGCKRLLNQWRKDHLVELENFQETLSERVERIKSS